MAYNDYEVITYKILKYLYDCLKEDVDIERIRLTREYYDVPRKYWEFILCNLIECGFVFYDPLKTAGYKTALLKIKLLL